MLLLLGLVFCLLLMLVGFGLVISACIALKANHPILATLLFLVELVLVLIGLVWFIQTLAALGS